MSQFYRVVEHTVDCHHSREYVTATVHGDADKPRLAVKQYIPLDNPDPQPGDVTIIGAHANGFPKELYEPLWDDLYARAAKSGIRIRSIWMADMWNQGQSGVLNEAILANDPSWWDHARDLLHLINQKRDEMPHPLVGIGHSMGGAQLTLIALSNPRLFRSLVLLDPVLQLTGTGIAPAMASTRRRDLWPSRAAAAAMFRQSKFYQAWDARVFDRWIRHGLRPLPTALYPSPPSASTTTNPPAAGGTGGDDDQPVTLTTTKHQELFTFLRPTYSRLNDSSSSPLDRPVDLPAHIAAGGGSGSGSGGYPFYRPEPLYAFSRLPELRPSVLYVFGGESDMSTPELRRAKMAATGTGAGGSGGAARGRVREVVLEGRGHLVAMEAVAACADAVAGFLKDEMALWRAEMASFERSRAAADRRELMVIDERWKRELKPKI
ncbi:cc4bb9db-94b1-4c3c-968c-334ec7b553ae [Thermothielavioides terrestris]|uniref:Cc4bb9db-94b1-4c3c-968c-334ec7b553ae n=1 Tax=Thermothielavioides terrestris TaxID=2587410 RepID=A0A3S4BNE8_9PEZI|nr:cc4bb9db-94b1-4c3c-968c-334ec7b553ae [Thermothielavioides terrestris]